MFDKLKNSVHMSDYKEVKREAQLNLQKFNDQVTKCTKYAQQLSDMQSFKRKAEEADYKFDALQEEKCSLE